MNFVPHPKWQDQLARLGNQEWSVARLIKLSQNFPVMEIPLEHMNIYHSFGTMTMREMIVHIKAINAADLKYPIILDEDGDIMDGRHRLMKAIITGKSTIKAVRFQTNPKPDKIYSEN